MRSSFFKVIGTLAVPRNRHVIVEVPYDTFCPLAGTNPDEPTDEPSSTQTPMTTENPPPEGLDETAALIIGGYNVDIDLNGATIDLSSVEIFGCPSRVSK